jgi:hypothetical protein
MISENPRRFQVPDFVRAINILSKHLNASELADVAVALAAEAPPPSAPESPAVTAATLAVAQADAGMQAASAARPFNPAAVTQAISNKMAADAALERARAAQPDQPGYPTAATGYPVGPGYPSAVGYRTAVDSAAISRLEASRAAQGGTFANPADQVDLDRLLALPSPPAYPQVP